jgi:hypothetical protein
MAILAKTAQNEDCQLNLTLEMKSVGTKIGRLIEFTSDFTGTEAAS